MKVLIIGGTGTISSAAARYALENGAQITLLNRGNHPGLAPDGAEQIHGDINDAAAMDRLLSGRHFDSAVNFNVFVPEQAKRDILLFSGRTEQYIFISSASVYQKPPAHCPITESTPVKNPYWRYAQDKIACETVFQEAYRAGFPVTIVRPSHTYNERKLPFALHGKKGEWQVLERMRLGKPIIVHGDGLSLWTFTHSSDFAAGLFGLMGNPEAVGETVHITGDEAVTWNAAHEAYGRVLGVKPNLVHIPSETLAAFNPALLGPLLGDKANCMVFDNSKIKRLVPGFSAKIRFSEGIRKSVDFYLSHPEYQVPDPEFDAWCDRVVGAYNRGIKSFFE